MISNHPIVEIELARYNFWANCAFDILFCTSVKDC